MLYAQNGKTMVKNAIWLSLIMWVLAFVVFLVMLAPAGAHPLLACRASSPAGPSCWPSSSPGRSSRPSSSRSSIAALMQVYFKVIGARCPIPNGTAGWARASKHFRELKDKALASFGGSRWAPGAQPG